MNVNGTLIQFFACNNLGSKFWRFDPTQKPPVKSTYPKPISNWEGIPDNIDDALQYTNGYTYFFKNGQYWRFNDRTFSVIKIINFEIVTFTVAKPLMNAKF